MLAHSLLESPGNAAAALNMIHQVRSQPQSHEIAANENEIHLLAVKALMELDRPEDAALELSKLAAKAAPVTTLLHALQLVLSQKQQDISFTGPMEQALKLILRRKNEDADITSKVMGLLLEKVIESIVAHA